MEVDINSFQNNHDIENDIVLSDKMLEEINTKLSQPRFIIIYGLFAVIVGVLICMYSAAIFWLYLFIISPVLYIAYLYDEKKRISKVNYNLKTDSRFNILMHAFTELSSTNKIWQVYTEQVNTEFKRNSGASKLISRTDVILTRTMPPYLKTDIDNYSIKIKQTNCDICIFFMPDSTLLFQNTKYSKINYNSIGIDMKITNFIETERVPNDSTITGYSWRYSNKNGDPDRRYRDNHKIPNVQYAEIIIMNKSTGNIICQLQISNIGHATNFKTKFEEFITQPSSLIKSLLNQDDKKYEQEATKQDKSSFKDIETASLCQNNLEAQAETNNVDNSIIDVTDQLENLPIQTKVKERNSQEKNESNSTLNNIVPYWEHMYVYSFNDLHHSDSTQRAFYYHFKDSFLNNSYLDLGGNSNYAFILMFDLLENDFVANQNLNILEHMIFRLIEHYPLTKPYALRNLIKRLQENSADENIQSVKTRLGDEYYRWEGEYYYARVKLGNKFKEKLNLSDSEVKLLNKNVEAFNVFLQIEFCYIAVVKFYLIVVEQINENFKKNGSSLEEELKIIADIDYHKGQEHFGSYEKSVESTVDYLYTYIMFFCEAEVREFYGYNRKLQKYFVFYSKTEEAVIERIEPAINMAVSTQRSKIMELDEATTIILNLKCPARWKIAFSEIAASVNTNTINDYYLKVMKLVELNKSDKKVIQNICFEAFKKAAKFNSEVAIKIYFLYLDSTDKLSFKQIPKAIQKSLFTNQNQLNEFEKIKNVLLLNHNLESAINSIPDIYIVQRKKINLDKSIIGEIHKQYSNTVELLNEYLKDEEGSENEVNNPIKEVADEIANDVQVKTQIIVKSNDSDLSSVQYKLIELFANNGFIISVDVLDKFAINNSVFRSSLIDGINERYYDLLDDILIEQSDEAFSINQNYYNRIFTK